MDWKTWTAMWGAGLSTWLALRSWLKNRPLITFEPTSPRQQVDLQWYLIRLRNTTGQPIVFHSVRVYLPRKAQVQLISNRQRIIPRQHNKPKNLLLYPGQEIFVQVDLSGFDTHFIAMLRWNFLPGGLHLPRVAPFLVTRKQLASKRQYDFIGNSTAWDKEAG